MHFEQTYNRMVIPPPQRCAVVREDRPRVPENPEDL